MQYAQVPVCVPACVAFVHLSSGPRHSMPCGCGASLSNQPFGSGPQWRQHCPMLPLPTPGCGSLSSAIAKQPWRVTLTRSTVWQSPRGTLLCQGPRTTRSGEKCHGRRPVCMHSSSCLAWPSVCPACELCASPPLDVCPSCDVPCFARRVWDLKSQACRAILSGHKKTIRSLAIGPDGRTLISGSQDNTIRWACYAYAHGEPCTRLALPGSSTASLHQGTYLVDPHLFSAGCGT